MAYNKSKYVDAAQKLLNQGKVPQAIAEYQQILKFEPRDQVTLMTIGELYIRQGETFQAIDYFERLAQIFVGDGFLTKAIAVYKRIAKLAPEEIRPLEKLADLYVQQGVMSEARPLFLQLAEIHLKNNRQPEAVGLLKKLLFAEPDNLRIQIRLADLYQAMGQTREAIETYVSAAQRALARGDHAESDKLADKALKLESHNIPAVIVKARSSASQGNISQATQLLEHVPDLEKGGEQTELLLDLLLKSSRWDQAITVAFRVFEADEKNFGPLQKIVEGLLESGNAEKAMDIVERTRIPMIDAGEHEVVGRMLTELASRLPGRLEPLEWLVDTYGRTSDSFRLPDALAQFGDALVALKQYDRAKIIYEQLVEREPENEAAKSRLSNCIQKMSAPAAESPKAVVPPPTPETFQAEIPKPPAPKVRSAPAPPPVSEVVAKPGVPAVVEPPLDEDTQRFIAQSLTDVDLFASYGLTQKAIGLLEAILRRAPRHTPTLEKLLDFVLGAGDDRRTAELAAHLEQIHRDHGDMRSSERFGELRRRFQRAAGLTDEEIAAAIAPHPTEAPFVEAEASVAENVAETTVAEPPGPALEIPEFPEIALPEPVQATPPPPPPAPQARPVEPAKTVVAQTAPPPPPPVPPPPAMVEAAQEVHEVDLSDEWASLLDGTPASELEPAAHSPAAAEEPAEFEISLEAEAVQEQNVANFAIEEDVPVVPAASAPVSAEFDTAPMVPNPLEEHDPFAEISVEFPVAEEDAAASFLVEEQAAQKLERPLEFEEPKTQRAKISEPEIAKPKVPEPKIPEPKIPEPKVSEPEFEPLFELEQEYELVLNPEPLVPAYDQRPPEVPIVPLLPEPEPFVANEAVPAASTNGFASEQFLADLANEIDQLGLGELAPSFSEPSLNSNHKESIPHDEPELHVAPEVHAASENHFAPEPHPESHVVRGSESQQPAASPATSETPEPLKEVFDEFRAELGEMGAEEEDLETHYNLGIAFREMGLLEEAISEFQKVAKANQNGRPFRYTMQCYTLLGLTFMDKGLPAIAAIWYERALKSPGIEPESILALRYDLGVAQESAGELDAALKSFSQVYAVNIDYRDVAERIAALQKPIR